MPGMPELPVNVPLDQEQVNGVRDKKPVYDTQRGFEPDSRDVSSTVPPTVGNREIEGAGRWVGGTGA